MINDRLISNFLFIFVLVINARSILSATVISLLIKSSRVVSKPEYFHQLFVSNYFWVVVDLKNFSMSSLTSADVFIRGVVSLPVGVATNNQLNTLDSVKH